MLECGSAGQLAQKPFAKHSLDGAAGAIRTQTEKKGRLDSMPTQDVD
jgi:hypothetical protein